MAKVDNLAGHLNEPYQKTRVLEAARGLGYPFTLSEIVTATGLPAHTVHRVLDRLIRQRVLTRRRMAKTYPQTGGPRRIFVPGGKQRRVYLYSFVERA